MENFATFLSIVSIVVSVVTYVITIKPNLKTVSQIQSDLEQFRNQWKHAQISQNPDVDLSILMEKGRHAMASNYMNLRFVRIPFCPRTSSAIRELGNTIFYFMNQIESNHVTEAHWEAICVEVGKRIKASFELLAKSRWYNTRERTTPPKFLRPELQG